MGREWTTTSSPIGLVPDGWSLVRLKAITMKIGSGATPKGGSEAYLAGRVNYSLIRSQNVYDRHFEPNGLAFITDQQGLMASLSIEGTTSGVKSLAKKRSCTKRSSAHINRTPSPLR